MSTTPVRSPSPSENQGEAFGQAYLKAEYADVTVRSAEGKEFLAHRFVLSARSKFFKTMLRAEMKERIEGVIELPEDASSTVGVAIEYIYSNRADYLNNLNYTSDPGQDIWYLHVAKVYALADRLTLPGLKTDAAGFLRNKLVTQKKVIQTPDYLKALEIAYTQLPAEDRQLKDALIEYVDAHAISQLAISDKFMAWLEEVPALAVDLAVSNARKYTAYVSYNCGGCKEEFSMDTEPKKCPGCGKKMVLT